MSNKTNIYNLNTIPLKYLSNETWYWTTTIIVVLFLLWSAYSYSFQKAAIEGVRELGFPDFFRIQLIVLKILAAFCLILPFVPIQVKEWAYAGVALFLLTAIVAHIAHKDHIVITIINLTLLFILFLSNYYLHRMN